ncbi:MAG: JAB domain-containing protein, partial [Paracoccaceae bacterium]|nr:JAB domain-containing protein [Paracoccaceae bacterium]
MTTYTNSRFCDQAQLNFSQRTSPVRPEKSRSKIPSYIADHRKRLRQRFESGGADAMPDYELLELFLFHVLPRIDTKPIAHSMLEKFSNLAGAAAAPLAELTSVDGVGPAVAREVKVLEAISQRIARSDIEHREVISSWDAVVTYCRAAMANRNDEQFRVLFLDRKNCLIRDELLGQGTVDHVPVYPREIVKRAL